MVLAVISVVSATLASRRGRRFSRVYIVNQKSIAAGTSDPEIRRVKLEAT